MKRHGPVVLAALLAAVALVVSGCAAYAGTSLVPAGKPLQVAQAVSSEELVGAINGFGADLLKVTATADTAGGNTIVSPASVHAALSMTVNGATGETAAQMREVLRIGALTPDETNEQWAALLGGLQSRSALQTLEIANALWAREGIAFKKPFLDADRDFFGAEVATMDFANGGVAGAINAWVSKNTNGMIPSIIDQVPADAILYLVNAVYFKGDWDSPFEAESTSRRPFTRADGSKVDVDMMHSTGFRPYAENDVLQAAKLDYKGLETGFYVLLPRAGVSLDAAMASLAGDGFGELRTALGTSDSREVALGLPKLDSELSVDLATQLAGMGMPRAFDDLDAEFSGMADLNMPIFINRVLHKTKVKVDEKGTEAAAATAVEMLAKSAIVSAEPLPFVCDRPYLFAIVDEKSGAMLFLGVVNDPTK